MIPLRPHHGMCLCFFCGHGYSEEFTANMKDFIQRCDTEDPEIRLVCSTDLLCEKCPHRRAGACESDEKALRYDHEVLRLCGSQEDSVLRFSKFRKKVKEMILDRGLRRSVCADCGWDRYCN